MKANAVKIAEGIYWTGVLDWDIRNYHGYTLKGTTYNSYLLKTKKPTVAPTRRIAAKAISG